MNLPLATSLKRVSEALDRRLGDVARSGRRPWNFLAMIAYSLKHQYAGWRVLCDPKPWRRGAVVSEFLPRFGLWMPLVFVHGAVVWGLGRRFGLPQLLWHDHPGLQFVNGVMVALLFGFGVFLLFLLDYSEWLEERDDLREKFRRTLADELGADPAAASAPARLADRFTCGSRHWTNPAYDLFQDLQTPDAPDPNQDPRTMARLQSHLFRCLFFGMIVLWLTSWAVARWMAQVAPVHEVPGFASDLRPGVTALPAGFSVGLALVFAIDVGKVKFWLRPNQLDFTIPGWEQRTLFTLAIPAMVLLLTVHGALLLVHGIMGLGSLAVPALCVALAEFSVVCAVAMWALRRDPTGRRAPGRRHARLIAGLILAGWLALALGARNRFNEPSEVKLSTPLAFEPSTLADSYQPGVLFKDSPPLDSWRQDRPLVVVCCSGGGITAQAWSILMLTRLDHDLKGPRPFRDKVGLVCGASGGMVGAAAWVGHLARPSDADATLRPFAERWKTDQLSPLVERLGLWDFSLGLAYQAIPGTPPKDRGHLLETIWTTAERRGKPAVFPELGQRLSDFRKREQAGELPSLIFSPALANDGRRLLISNLELDRLSSSGTHGHAADPRIRSAIHLESSRDEPPLATWARMSATFPFVTPTAPLHAHLPEGRCDFPVDAGYYDNFGTALAIGWLREYWLPAVTASPEKFPRQVILIELDAYPRFPASEGADASVSATARRLERSLFGDLARPLEAIRNVAAVSTQIRNDEQVEAFALEVERLKDPDLRFDAFRFTNGVDASLSWRLTGQEIQVMEEWIESVFEKDTLRERGSGATRLFTPQDAQAHRLRADANERRSEHLDKLLDSSRSELDHLREILATGS